MITIKTSREIELMRRGGKILARIMQLVMKEIRPGISTQHLDTAAERLIAEAGATPSFKGYDGYPAATCISVNSEVVHAVPRADKYLHQGDIVSVDIGLLYEGMFTDMARTVTVGRVRPRLKKLVAVTDKALRIGVRAVRAGKTTGDIGHAIQRYVEQRGFSVVRSLVGHGVGREVHEGPQVPNFGTPGEGTVLSAGMTLALEPMVTSGSHEVATRDDGWSIATVDGSMSAHFEDTILVTKHGAEALTT